MHLHKKYIKLLAIALISPWFLSSCIEEGIEDCPLVMSEEIGLPDGNYVMSFDLRFTDSGPTRADGNEVLDGDLVQGEHQEHQIRTNGLYALFFSETGNLVNVIPLRANHYYDKENEDPEDKGREEDTGNEITGGKGDVEGTYYATYQVKRSLIKPASCLVLMNVPNAIIAKLTDKSRTFTLTDVLEMTWDDTDEALNIGHSDSKGELTSTNYDYLAMSNSSYIENGKVVCAVPVDIEKNFVPEEWLVGVDPFKPWTGVIVKDDEGKEVNLEERVVVVPVERMLAKFNFEISPNTGANYDAQNQIFTPEDNKLNVFMDLDGNGNHHNNYTDYYYKVKVTGWGINALETKNHLFKQLSEGTDYFPNVSWNDPDNLRSYWSEDPHYEYSEDYPKQFRKALDKLNMVYYEDLIESEKDPEKEPKNRFLQNYSYDNLNYADNPENAFTKTLFAPENTYDYKDNKWNLFYDRDRLHLLTGSHIIVCAELLTNMENQNEFKKGEFFRDRNGVWYKNEKELFKAMIQTLSNEFKSQSEMRFIYKNWGEDMDYSTVEDIGKQIILDTDGEWFMYYGENKIDLESYEDIYDKMLEDADNGCKATAKAYISNSDGQRIIWFQNISIRDAAGNPIQRCTINGFDNRGHAIKKHLGPLDHNHHKSLLYEWLGVVDHFREGKMYYAAPIENLKLNGEENYGVLRNTWYKISLGNINSLGTSVDDPTEPIVPNKTTQENQMTFNVDIIGWHTIEINVPF